MDKVEMKDHENENIEPVRHTKAGSKEKKKGKKFARGSFEDKIWLELDDGKVVQKKLTSPNLRPLRRQQSSEIKEERKRNFTAELTTRLSRRSSSSFTEHDDSDDDTVLEKRLVGVANWEKLSIDVVTQLLIYVKPRDLGALGTCHNAFNEPCALAARRLARSLSMSGAIERAPFEPWWLTAHAADIFSRYGHYSQVAAGGSHELMLHHAGHLYARGRGPCGQLGLGPQVFESEEPLRISLFQNYHQSTSLTFVHLAAGAHHSLAIDHDGNLWVFGKYRDRIYEPRLERFHGGMNKPILKHCSAGTHHSLCVDTLGRVWAMGKNTHGQLGLGGRRSSELPEPRIITALESSRAVAVAAGHFHSLVLDDDGALYAFGLGADGRLGLGHCLNASLPERVLLPHNIHVADLAAGVSHSACTDSLGRIYTWGDVARGALGHRDVEASRSPRLLDCTQFEKGFHASQVSRFMKPRCSLLRTLAIDDNGRLWSISNFTAKRISIPQSRLSALASTDTTTQNSFFRVRDIASSSEDIVLLALSNDAQPQHTIYLDLTQLDRANTPRIKTYALS